MTADTSVWDNPELLFATGDKIPRDHFGRPLVVPASGGKPVPYTRMTTVAEAPDDRYRLELWKMRMTALGIVERDDLHLAVAAHRDDKDELDRICDQAIEAAKASAGATMGTAIHALCDQWDRGQLDLNRVPAAFRKDVEAYARATEHLEAVDIEQFGVLDDYSVGGTWDRLYRTKSGRLVIGDTKTGKVIGQTKTGRRVEFGMGKIAVQLAGYSRATPYDYTTGQRGTSNPDRGVDQSFGIVMHIPAGQGTCELIEVNLTAGWEGFALALQVRQWRARRSLSRPYAGENVADPDLLDAIASAPDVTSLRLLWAENHAGGKWTDKHTAAAEQRKAELAAS